MNKIIFFIVTLLVSCSHGKIETNKEKNIDTKERDSQSTSLVSISIKSNKFYTESDVDCQTIKSIKEDLSSFISDTFRIQKNRGNLVLPLSNGKNIVLSDSLTNDDESREYKYLGHFTSIDFYLVKEILWEENYYYLIDIKTGNKTEINGIPKLSPNNEYLINENEMGGFGDNQFGFELWKFDKNKRTLTLIPTLQQDEWYPIDFAWKNEQTALIKVMSISSKEFGKENYENSKDCVCKKLEIK